MRKNELRPLVEIILSEFPWLWAIHPEWHPTMKVKIVEVQLMDPVLSAPAPAGAEWWMLCRDTATGGQRVGKINTDELPEQNGMIRSPFLSASVDLLAALLVVRKPSPYEILAIASRTAATCTIYRAQKGSSLDLACLLSDWD